MAWILWVQSTSKHWFTQLFSYKLYTVAKFIMFLLTPYEQKLAIIDSEISLHSSLKNRLLSHFASRLTKIWFLQGNSSVHCWAYIRPIIAFLIRFFWHLKRCKKKEAYKMRLRHSVKVRIKTKTVGCWKSFYFSVM